MNIVWLNSGSKAYEYIMTCSVDFYGTTLLRRLSQSIKKAETLLRDNPKMGSIEPLAEGRDFEYRNIVLVKPFKLIYTIYEDTLYIADIWDTRQSPETLANRI